MNEVDGLLPPALIASLTLSKPPFRRLCTDLDRRSHEPLLKPVVAVAGDMVEVDVKGIRVNGVSLPNSTAAFYDQQGRKMPSFIRGRYHVQKSTLWVVSGHSPRSFDSRYFGAIPVKQVMAVARVKKERRSRGL
jgi:conjugative transfer signal peptidase TraF